MATETTADLRRELEAAKAELAAIRGANAGRIVVEKNEGDAVKYGAYSIRRVKPNGYSRSAVPVRTVEEAKGLIEDLAAIVANW